MTKAAGKAGRYLLHLLAFAALALLALGLASIFNFWWLLLWLLLYAMGQGG